MTRAVMERDDNLFLAVRTISHLIVSQLLVERKGIVLVDFALEEGSENTS